MANPFAQFVEEPTDENPFAQFVEPRQENPFAKFVTPESQNAPAAQSQLAPAPANGAPVAEAAFGAVIDPQQPAVIPDAPQLLPSVAATQGFDFLGNPVVASGGQPTLSEIHEVGATPLVDVGKLLGPAGQKFVGQVALSTLPGGLGFAETKLGGDIATGIGGGASAAASGLTSPENIALLASVGGAPKALQSVVSGAFTVMMGKEIPAQAKAVLESKSPEEAAQRITELVATGVMTAAAGAHAIKGIKEIPWKRSDTAQPIADTSWRGGEPPPLPEVIAQAKAAESNGLDQTAKALIETAGEVGQRIRDKLYQEPDPTMVESPPASEGVLKGKTFHRVGTLSESTHSAESKWGGGIYFTEDPVNLAPYRQTNVEGGDFSGGLVVHNPAIFDFNKPHAEQLTDPGFKVWSDAVGRANNEGRDYNAAKAAGYNALKDAGFDAIIYTPHAKHVADRNFSETIVFDEKQIVKPKHSEPKTTTAEATPAETPQPGVAPKTDAAPANVAGDAAQAGLTRDVSKPEQMTPNEVANMAAGIRKFDTAMRVKKTGKIINTGNLHELPKGMKEMSLEAGFIDRATGEFLTRKEHHEQVMSFAKTLDAERRYAAEKGRAWNSHQIAVELALQENKPVSAAAVNQYQAKLPEGYVKRGDLYVREPPVIDTPEKAARATTSTSSAETGKAAPPELTAETPASAAGETVPDGRLKKVVDAEIAGLHEAADPVEALDHMEAIEDDAVRAEMARQYGIDPTGKDANDLNMEIAEKAMEVKEAGNVATETPSSETTMEEEGQPYVDPSREQLPGGGTMKRNLIGDESGGVINPMTELAKPVAQSVEQISQAVGAQSVPKSVKAGIGQEVVQHAAARIYLPHFVRDVLARVFPETYTNAEAMRPTMEILNKDNILGGYDDARAELAALEQARDQGKATDKQVKEQQRFVDNIAAAHNLEQYDRDVRSAPKTVRDNIQRWRDQVVPIMDGLYNEMKDIDPDTPREGRGRHFDARVNLLPENKAERLRNYSNPDKSMPAVSTSNYRNPNVKRDAMDKTAFFTGKYSSDPELMLLNSFANRWNEVTKLRLYNSIVERGIGKIIEPGESPPATINGKETARLAVKMPETNAETGKTRMVEKSLYVPRELVGELRRTLDTDMRGSGHPVAHALTQIQLLQLADATAHIKNIHSVIANSLGRDAAWKDVATKIPFVSSINAIAEITSVAREISADAPAIRSEIARLAKEGMIRPEYPPTGIQKITHMQALIHDVDTASRIIMARRFDQMVRRGIVEDTPLARRNFVQQLGEYNRRLMGRWEQSFRDMGLSPFIVAGRTFNRFSRRLVTGDPGFKAKGAGEAVKARATQLASLAFAATLPALINMFTTGSMGGRPGTPVGAIDFGPKFDTDDGRRRGLDVFQITGIRRGLRSVGLNAAIEGVRQGKTTNQILGDAASDAITTAAHPWTGPALGAAFQTLTGKRLDLRSGWDFVETKQVGGGKQYLENARVALKQQNPFLYAVGEAALGSGDPTKTMLQKSEEGAKAIAAGLLKSPQSALGIKQFDTPAVTMARGIQMPFKKTESSENRYEIRKEIEKLKKTNPEAAQKLAGRRLEEGKITESDLRTMKMHDRIPDYLTRKVKAMAVNDAINVLRLTTHEEMEVIKPIVAAKLARSTSLTSSERKELQSEYKKITGEDPPSSSGISIKLKLAHKPKGML